MSEKDVRFGVRLSPAEVIQLEAIAHHLGVTKTEVVRLSLSSQANLKNSKPDEIVRKIIALSESVDAAYLRIRAVDDRLQGMESLLSGAVDLLLSLSRTAQQKPRQPEPVQGEKTQAAQPAPAGPKWSEYLKKNYKTNPVMSDGAWAEFLKKRYTEQHGFPPDLST